MSNVFGQQYRISIFGESHSAAIGIVIDGIPAGMEIDMDDVCAALERRAPNKSAASTKRRETDRPEILSGYFQGKAAGTPLAAIIHNNDTRSADYEKTKALLRPGHADYVGHMKYDGANDYRGGGHFSGRLTAPVVFAGAIARQYLAGKGIFVGAHINSIADVHDAPFTSFSRKDFDEIEKQAFPTIDRQAADTMQAQIQKVAKEGDSLGGTIECAVSGVPVGLGEPFFDSIESCLSHLLFSIPAIKGVEFGTGFGLTTLQGSEANDCPVMSEGKISFRSNHNGGINGGLTNGMPIVFRVAVKPTPSISKQQGTVDMARMENANLAIVGRHDACIVPRAVEVVKSAAAIVCMDLYLRNGGGKNDG